MLTNDDDDPVGGEPPPPPTDDVVEKNEAFRCPPNLHSLDDDVINPNDDVSQPASGGGEGISCSPRSITVTHCGSQCHTNSF